MNDTKESNEPDTKKRKADNESTPKDHELVSCNNKTQFGIDSFNNDIVIRFASYLCSRDLVSLALSCRKFGSRQLHDRELSLVETTAQKIMCNAEQEERGALPRRTNQTYIELYSELEQYREPRVFDHLIGEGITYATHDDESHIIFVSGCKSTAICNHVMRAGKHYATFTIMEESSRRIGIVRPLNNLGNSSSDDDSEENSSIIDVWNSYPGGRRFFDPFIPIFEENESNELLERWGEDGVDYCSLTVNYRGGRCYWCSWQPEDGRKMCQWNGSEGFDVGDEIGMLLDLNVGTLCIYKNGRRLGILKDGLAGEYCWVATMWMEGDSLRIKKGHLPD